MVTRAIRHCETGVVALPERRRRLFRNGGWQRGGLRVKGVWSDLTYTFALIGEKGTRDEGPLCKRCLVESSKYRYPEQYANRFGQPNRATYLPGSSKSISLVTSSADS